MDLGDLRGYMDAKGFDLEVIARLAQRNQFAALFQNLVLRSKSFNLVSLNQYAEALSIVEPAKMQARSSYAGWFCCAQGFYRSVAGEAESTQMASVYRPPKAAD